MPRATCDVPGNPLPNRQRIFDLSPTATGFQSPEWVEAYHATFGDDADLGFHRDGAFALASSTRRVVWGARVLELSGGHDLADYTDILLGGDAASADGCVTALTEQTDIDVIHLPHTPPWAAAWRVAARWPGEVAHLPSSACPSFDGGSVEDYLARLPGRPRREFTRQRRRIDEAGYTWDVAPSHPTTIRATIEHFLGWHIARWTGRGLNPLHATPMFREFLVTLATGSRAHIVRLRRRGRIHGYVYVIVDRNRVRNYLVAYPPGERTDVSRNVLQVLACFDVLDGSREGVDFLRGAHREKLKFASSVVQNRRLLLVRPGSTRGYAYAAAWMGRARAASTYGDLRTRLRTAVVGMPR